MSQLAIFIVDKTNQTPSPSLPHPPTQPQLFANLSHNYRLPFAYSLNKKFQNTHTHLCLPLELDLQMEV